MHFEVLVEDRSGALALEAILPKILGPNGSDHSWWLHPYKGIGRVPRNMSSGSEPAKRILLENLPRLLCGYGRSLDRQLNAVIVAVDLDDRDCMAFKQELLDVLKVCNPAPETLFRIAIEESEAWLLGDRDAVMAAYPDARRAVLDRYFQDAICGTWEVLADAVHPGGAVRLKPLGYPAAGAAKCEWAEKIAPHMDVERNRSESFQVFRDGVRRLAEGSHQDPPPH